MSKKFLSIVLVLVLVLSMGTVAMFSASASLEDLPEKADGTNRYFFYLPEEWLNKSTETTGNTAGIYWWEGTDAHGGWPGIAATPADVDGVYYYDVPTDVTTIVWNNYFDGGMDTTTDYYADAIQTRNIGTEYYDPGESDRYPEGTDDFDNMIYVVDFAICDYNDYSGKMQFGGDWFYYYGNGEYGTSEVKGESEVYTERVLNQELGMPRDEGNTTPSETEPSASETEPTETEPTFDTAITMNGVTKPAMIGDTITYTMMLQADQIFEDIQVDIFYDNTVLKLADGTNAATACPNIGTGLMFNTALSEKVTFNAVSIMDGYDFTQEKVLVTLDFEVIAAGETAIDGVIVEMTIKETGESYFSDGEPVVTDGITVGEELIVPELPKPTDPDPSETTTPTETEKPDATSVTGTSAGDETDAPGTGATAYIYIALAIVAMAAAAVVVLRKKVNG